MKQYKLGICFSFIHFSAETACFYFLFSRLSADPAWWGLALLFDAFAFLPQNIIGLIQDKYPKCNMGFWGTLLVLGALLIPADLVSLLIICIGNAMIHIGGAVYTLHGANGKIAPNAIFVGGGSFGVITGQLLGGLVQTQLLLIPLILMVVSCAMLLCISKKHTILGQPVGLCVDSDLGTASIVAFAFIAVAIRGYIGYAIPIEWNKTIPQAIALFVSMGVGKMLGGIVADRIGYRRTAYISLLAGLPFLLFGNSCMMVSLVGIALFSMTMPVTIAILVSRFPRLPGFAFGITTVALFAGILPAFFIQPQGLFAHQLTVVILSVLALLSIQICLKKGS